MKIIFLIFLLILSCFSLVITESFAVRQVHHSSELSAEHHDTLDNTISNLKSDMVITPYNDTLQSNTVYGLPGYYNGSPPNSPRNYWIPTINNTNNLTLGKRFIMSNTNVVSSAQTSFNKPIFSINESDDYSGVSGTELINKLTDFDNIRNDNNYNLDEISSLIDAPLHSFRIVTNYDDLEYKGLSLSEHKLNKLEHNKAVHKQKKDNLKHLYDVNRKISGGIEKKSNTPNIISNRGILKRQYKKSIN